MSQVVEAYRKAAMKLYGITRKEAEQAIYAPEDDPGEWAPKSLAVICFEWGDNMAANCGYWAPRGMDECFRLSGEAGTGYIEWINAAVGAVYA
jgi:hypothetical protein